MLDAAMSAETDVVVTRYGKPVVAIVAYADFEALHEEIEELRAARRALSAYQEWKDDPTTGESWEAVKQELAEANQVDE